MGRIVQKFSGNVLPDINAINKAAEIAIKAAEEGNEVATVVSSIGKTTDQLRTIAESVASTPNPRDLDMLLASAEQASVALLSMAIQSHGWPARAFTAAQAGIVTESRHGHSPIREICPELIEQSLDRGEIAVIGGFQGITEGHEITTVGDGGADSAAVALACSLDADRCDVYCDADGICTADPSIVSDARVLSALSYEEMMELANSGLSYMQSEAVELAMDNEVHLRIRPINNYDALGTMVAAHQIVPDHAMCSVTLDEQQTSFSLKIYATDEMEKSVEAFASLFARLDELSIATDMIMMINREDEPSQELSFTVNKRNVQRVRAVVDAVAGNIGHPIVRIDPQIARLSVVGRGISHKPDMVARIFETLRQSSIPVHMVSTSNLRVSLLLPVEHGRFAVKLFHSRFQLPYSAID